MRLHLCIGTLGIALLCVTQSIAQQKPSITEADCYAQQTALEEEMRAARSRGQMLRRRQLEESLHALQSRCEEVASKDTHEARVMRQKYVVLQRQLDLDRAEEQLRQLLSEKP